ncbi:hypothetical protein HX079_18205, partial [Myroides odoratimimus]|uniref:DUF6896 domain-containing protein n=1 Tax=Myroides odoratimimus TaxID=76832 RepID=UPI002576464D
EEDIYQEIYKININSNGTKNYKHGNIDGYEYHYHGGGCFIQKGNIECDFNFTHYIDDLTYQFTSKKLKEFIDSNYHVDIDVEKLKELVKEGFLLPVISEGRVWNSFLIKRYS